MWVAHNKTVPHEILVDLAGDPDSRVRSMVASKRKLAPELQMQLGMDPDDSVRACIAYNPRATRAALEGLVADPWPEVAELARARLDAGQCV